MQPCPAPPALPLAHMWYVPPLEIALIIFLVGLHAALMVALFAAAATDFHAIAKATIKRLRSKRAKKTVDASDDTSVGTGREEAGARPLEGAGAEGRGPATSWVLKAPPGVPYACACSGSVATLSPQGGKETKNGKESLWLSEAPVRNTIPQMHTPARTSQCWSRQTPAWTWGVRLDAPGQRHGQQPVSGTADPRSSQTGQVIRGLC